MSKEEIDRWVERQRKSYFWFKMYLISIFVTFALAALITMIPAIGPLAEVNVTTLNGVATCAGIVYALILMLMQRPSYLIRLHKLIILHLNTMWLTIMAFGLYLLASGKVSAGFPIRIVVDLIFVAFYMTLGTLTFFVSCEYRFEIEKEDKEITDVITRLKEKERVSRE
jgi:hypothetical protein